MRFLLFIVSIIISFNMLDGQVRLSLDLEIKEPKGVIFNKIVDIAVDSQNDMYILDSKEKELYKFSEEGEFLKKIGRPGQGPGEFKGPRSVFIDDNDNIFILDSQNRRVEVFKNTGNFTKSIKLKRFSVGGRVSLAVDENGNFYIAGYYSEDNVVLCKYSPSGEFLKAIPLPVIEYNGIELTKLRRISINQNIAGGSLCFDEENRIYYSYSWPYKIIIIENEENILSDISGTSNLNWTPLIFNSSPDGMFFGEATFSKKIFWLNNEYLINSIKCVDWKGNPKVKVPTQNILNRTGLDKYFKVERVFAVLDIFNKGGQFIASSMISDKIIFLNSDNKNRILGVKDDGENLPTIVRYKVEINEVDDNY